MSLFAKQREAIENQFFPVWKIIELLYKQTNNNWHEVGQFLGHHDIDTEIPLFEIDVFWKAHQLHNNYEPLRKVIDLLLTILPWTSTEEIESKVKEASRSVAHYFWLKHDLYKFRPFIELGIVERPSNYPIIDIQEVAPIPLHQNDSERIIAKLEQSNLSKQVHIEKLEAHIEHHHNLFRSLDETIDKLSKENERLKNSIKTKSSEVLNPDELTPEQEIPNTRTRNNVLKIIAILADMANLSDQPYTAFTMMEAHAIQRGFKIPSKEPVADWLKKAKDSS